jgi:hypothetical protein
MPPAQIKIGPTCDGKSLYGSLIDVNKVEAKEGWSAIRTNSN